MGVPGEDGLLSLKQLAYKSSSADVRDSGVTDLHSFLDHSGNIHIAVSVVSESAEYGLFSSLQSAE